MSVEMSCEVLSVRAFCHRYVLRIMKRTSTEVKTADLEDSSKHL
jgi:hypothetical protein